jgi:hypothetical protein
VLAAEQGAVTAVRSSGKSDAVLRRVGDPSFRATAVQIMAEQASYWRSHRGKAVIHTTLAGDEGMPPCSPWSAQERQRPAASVT